MNKWKKGYTLCYLIELRSKCLIFFFLSFPLFPTAGHVISQAHKMHGGFPHLEGGGLYTSPQAAPQEHPGLPGSQGTPWH